MKRILAIACLAMLGACNMVVTRTPVFSTADTSGGPRLRDGVWDEPPSAKCSFDEHALMKTWPGCANGMAVRGSTLWGYAGQDTVRRWTSTGYVLANGGPLVMQIHLTNAVGKSAPTPSFYVYVDISPTQSDAQGRVTAFDAWPALCGPPPQPQSSNAGASPQAAQTFRAGTLQPLPGLVMDQDGNECTTNSKDAVRNAAYASRAWNDQVATEHWVRNGDQ